MVMSSGNRLFVIRLMVTGWTDTTKAESNTHHTRTTVVETVN